MKIPLVRPLMPDLCIVDSYLERNRKSGVWSNFGPNWDDCVKRLKERTRLFCLPVTSGTTAIALALRYLRGSAEKLRVLVPDYTHSGSLLAVSESGNSPLLGPVAEGSWMLDLNEAYKIRDHFDAMIVVVPFGYRVDIEQYEEFSYRFNKKIVYDFAGAWGSFPQTSRWPICYSFHATKNFAIGEGGMVCVQTKDQFDFLKHISNFGTNPDRSISGLTGTNSKIDEWRAAMILAQLDSEKLIFDRINSKKEALMFYQKNIACKEHDLGYLGSPSLCVLGGVKHARKLELDSEEAGLGIRAYYPLLSRMSALRGVPRGHVSGDFFTTCLALPSDVNDEEMRFVAEWVNLKLKSYGN